MYARRRTPPLPVSKFIGRMALHGCVALLVISVSLVVGMFDFHHFLASRVHCIMSRVPFARMSRYVSVAVLARRSLAPGGTSPIV